jgi:hypothetical protein
MKAYGAFQAIRATSSSNRAGSAGSKTAHQENEFTATINGG